MLTRKPRRIAAPRTVAPWTAAPWTAVGLAVGLAVAAPPAVTAGSASQAAAERPVLLGAFKDDFTILKEPVPAPRAGWEDGQGNRLTLADYRGRVVLLNFWATWCGPCVHEMPGLDSLQAELGEAGLTVLTVSADRGGARVVAPFLAENGLDNLGVHLDPRGKFALSFGVRGLPTTWLIDRRGLMVGLLEGPAEWDSQEAQVLIEHYLEQDAAPAGDAPDSRPPSTLFRYIQGEAPGAPSLNPLRP